MPAWLCRETLELAVLIHLSIGTLFWCFVLIPTGVVGRALAGRPSPSLAFGYRASLIAILVWPWFAWITWKRRKEVGVALRRVWLGVRR